MPEVAASMEESVHQLLEVMFCVCSDGCIVYKEHVSYGGFADLGLCSESCDVVQLAIWSCMHVNSLGQGPKGMFKREGEEDAIECRGKDAALLHRHYIKWRPPPMLKLKCVLFCLFVCFFACFVFMFLLLFFCFLAFDVLNKNDCSHSVVNKFINYIYTLKWFWARVTEY